jgi:hypothetical protein
MEFAPIKDAIYTWISDQTKVKVIWSEQAAPRPPRPYIDLKLITGAIKLGGQDNLRTTSAGRLILVGPRSVTCSIQIFGDNAMEILTTARDSLDDPDVIEQLDRAGLSVADDGEPQNITEALETHFEARAAMDVRFEFQVERDTESQTVERVSLDGKDISIS